jgi:hypothetical protein
MEQQIIVEKDSNLEVQVIEQPLVSINEPITAEVLSLDSVTDTKVITEESAVLLVLTEGGSLYKKSVNDGYSGTELEWLTELLDSKASVQFVVTTMADGFTAYASALLALKAEVGDTYASNTRLSEVLATRDMARALDKQILEAKIDSDIQASYTNVIDVMVTRDLAISQTLTNLNAEIGSFNSTISNVQQAIATETSARTLAINSMSSTLNNRINSEITTINQTVVDQTGSLAQQINSINTSFNNNLNSSINSVNTSISNETEARAQQIEVLRADFTTGLSAVLTELQEVRVDTEGNATAIDSVTATVTNPTTGLTASFNRANEAYSLADGTAGALSILTGRVNHATTGLAATYAFVQQVEINAATNTATAINSLRNEITSPSANWIAGNTFIQSIKSTADGNVTAISNLSNQVTTLSNGLNGTIDTRIASNSLVQSIKSTADGNVTAISNLGNTVTTLSNNLNGSIDTRIASNNLIQTIRSDLDGNIEAVSTLGNTVTTINNNLNGTIDTRIASNSLIQSIVDTNNNQQTTLTNLNSTLTTATTDITGLTTWRTNVASVQLTNLTNSVGQIESRAFLGVSSTSGGKATIAGITVSSVNYGIRMQGDVFELVNIHGARQLYFNNASGLWRFAGGIVTNEDGVSTRGEYTDDGTYLIWLGTGAKNDVNGTFWVKKDGTGYIKGTFFQGQLIRRRFNSANLASVTASGHITAGQPVRIDCTGYFRYFFTSATEPSSDAGLMNWVVKRNGTVIASGSRQLARIKRDPGGEPGVQWRNIDHVNMTIMVFDNSPGSFGTNNSYTFEMTDFGYGSYSTTVATDENLVG